MDVQSFSDFETSERAVLEFLHRRLGFDSWMATRTDGDAPIGPQTEGHRSAVAPGNLFRRSDAFCAEMPNGSGACIASHSAAATVQAEGADRRQIQIKTCVGQSRVRADARSVGSLGTVDPSPQPTPIGNEHELVELLGTLLSTLHQTELRVAEQTRCCEKLQTEALTDPMTSLYNLRGWDRLVAAEEERCRRYGHQAAVLVVDLDGLKHVNDTQGHAAGDQLIVRAGLALRQAARSLDVVARFGGDEFGILSTECNDAGGKALLDRVRTALEKANIKASIGLAMRDPAEGGLRGACKTADRRMYEEKHWAKSTPRSARVTGFKSRNLRSALG